MTEPKSMVKAFLVAGLIAGGFILLFSTVGLCARSAGLTGAATVSVPMAFGLPLLLVFNAIMLTSAGSTTASTFTSNAKLTVVGWPNKGGDPEHRQFFTGRRTMKFIALLGNFPLLSIYLGDGVGPTTISGTMAMGLAPIFLLSFLPSAGPVSFHLAFWPGLAFGVIKTVEAAAGMPIFPDWINIGGGKAAVNVPTISASIFMAC